MCSLKKKDIILGEGESTEVWTKGLLCARQAVHPWTKYPHYQKYLKMWGNYFNSNRSNYIQYIYIYITIYNIYILYPNAWKFLLIAVLGGFEVRFAC